MGTYENFYLNQIKQLQEENKKLKQIIDEGLVDVAGRVRSPGVLRALSKRDAAADQAEVIQRMAAATLRRARERGYRPSLDSPAPVVPGRIAEVPERFRPTKEKPYASDDMESRRTQPGYGISSDSQGAGPKSEVMGRMVADKIRRARESGYADDTIY